MPTPSRDDADDSGELLTDGLVTRPSSGPQRTAACGHDPAQFVTADEGTSYCPACEDEARCVCGEINTRHCPVHSLTDEEVWRCGGAASLSSAPAARSATGSTDWRRTLQPDAQSGSAAYLSGKETL